MAKEKVAPIVVWLRHDLRTDDNPALAHAAETGRPVIPLFILADENAPVRPYGSAHKWWLHHSLKSLSASFAELGSRLALRRGDAFAVLGDILSKSGATAVYLNRRYGPEATSVDGALEERFEGIDIQCFDAALLHDPDRIKTGSGGFYKVYTPFMKSVSAGLGELRHPIDAPSRLVAPEHFPVSESLDKWGLLPTAPNWAGGFEAEWTPGETHAQERLSHFCDELLAGYSEGRDRPSEDLTSRLSPHLHFGEVSALRALTMAEEQADRRKSITGTDRQTFRRELIWRDFNHHLLYHFQQLGSKNFNQRFDTLKWRDAAADLEKWQKGRTGYPIVDAGMRQLWQTGWMHNRVRMIVGSFLTKDLLIDWRKGEAWFWDTLVDGDEANNTSQWQWIAGTGADAQPFFRIFNPVKQSRDFDPGGDYIRSFVPELSKLPDKAIHAPWEADDDTLRQAGVALGETYPKPIVDHGEARDRANAAFQATR
ncbi:DNA photolyase family protein [Aureimonas altamirensis]|uniref:cryptochrome/photolyase family protein n=1 Tax=Aureimonas altamirensis TaxID=370622 RepID=UPI002036B854|nr:deoxyribodipyrimidine photo-lyase [Aureimonas altamirensis]MCM2503025.1 DNA photolyase family protein [Aureimonas altamirensis]